MWNFGGYLVERVFARMRVHRFQKRISQTSALDIIEPVTLHRNGLTRVRVACYVLTRLPLVLSHLAIYPGHNLYPPNRADRNFWSWKSFRKENLYREVSWKYMINRLSFMIIFFIKIILMLITIEKFYEFYQDR